ncbi:MAG: hypothetical protein V3S25_11565 [Nitrospirales bacterium]
MKPGIQTSEFKMALAVLVLIAVGTAFSGSPVAEAAGYIGAALTAAGYGFVRAVSKKSEADAAAGVVREKMWQAQSDRENETSLEVARLGGSK